MSTDAKTTTVELQNWNGSEWLTHTVVELAEGATPVVRDSNGVVYEGEELDDWNNSAYHVPHQGKRVSFLDNPELWIERIQKRNSTYSRAVVV